MTYPQAIFGAALAFAGVLLILGLAKPGAALQEGASFDFGAPINYSNQLVVAVLNTTNGDVRFCRGVGTLIPECGPWTGAEPVKE
jgi:hypothetical protein